MTDIFKFFFVITLAAICFLPQDGICADVTCNICSGDIKTGPPKCDTDPDNRREICSSGKCSVFAVVRDKPDAKGFTSMIEKRCGEDKDVMGCRATTKIFGGDGIICTCTNELCNSNLKAAGYKGSGPGPTSDTGSGSSCLHGWFSSVLISVFVIVIAVPFLRRS